MGQKQVFTIYQNKLSELLIINGETNVDESEIDDNCMYYYLFLCLYFIKQKKMYVLEDHLRVKRYPSEITSTKQVSYKIYLKMVQAKTIFGKL